MKSHDSHFHPHGTPLTNCESQYIQDGDEIDGDDDDDDDDDDIDCDDGDENNWFHILPPLIVHSKWT